MAEPLLHRRFGGVGGGARRRMLNEREVRSYIGENEERRSECHCLRTITSCSMENDRLSNILAEYLEGHLGLETAAAQLAHVYVEHGWGFYLVEEECRPEHRERMRALAARVEEAMTAAATSRRRSS